MTAEKAFFLFSGGVFTQRKNRCRSPGANRREKPFDAPLTRACHKGSRTDRTHRRRVSSLENISPVDTPAARVPGNLFLFIIYLQALSLWQVARAVAAATKAVTTFMRDLTGRRGLAENEMKLRPRSRGMSDCLCTDNIRKFEILAIFNKRSVCVCAFFKWKH